MSEVNNDLPPPLHIIIKQEKITPERDIKTENGDTYNNAVQPLPGATNDDDEKKPMEPVKSSNEILAELFQVLNAAPPNELMQTDLSFLKREKDKSKKHKSKDKKHKKKKSKIGEDGVSDSDENKKKRKKSKKDKKSDKSSDESEKLDKDGKHKKSKKRKKSKSRDSTDKVIKKEIKKEKKDESLPKEKESNHKSPAKEEPPSKKTKIVFSNLKNSRILENSSTKDEKSRKNKENSIDKSDGEITSDISLSDEESLINNKREYSNFYKKYDESRERRRSQERYDAGSRSHSHRHNDRTIDRHNSWRGRHDRSPSYHHHHRKYSRSRSRSRSPASRIDKKRLLEIARKNAIAMLKNGTFPGSDKLAPDLKEKALEKMRHGGKSIEELTEYCRKLSNGEALGDLSSVSDDDSDHDRDGKDMAFHHPFVLKERGPIVMNIRVSI